jgi:hypothetical protein
MLCFLLHCHQDISNNIRGINYLLFHAIIHVSNINFIFLLNDC